MDEQELRAMIRESIARHLGTRSAPKAPEPFVPRRGHPSHVLLPLMRGSDGDGACVIEPAVRCTHCGYCQSYGH